MKGLPSRYSYHNGYLDLPNLKFEGLPGRITVNGYELLLKSEFHISLVCAKRIAAIIDDERIEEIQAEIVDKFIRFVDQASLTTYRPLKQFRFVQRDTRRTVIMMVEVPRLEEFFELLENSYKKKLPLQPTHVTMYTLQLDTGIGILSDEQLEYDSVPVEIPELDRSNFSSNT